MGSYYSPDYVYFLGSSLFTKVLDARHPLRALCTRLGKLVQLDSLSNSERYDIAFVKKVSGRGNDLAVLTDVPLQGVKTALKDFDTSYTPHVSKRGLSVAEATH